MADTQMCGTPGCGNVAAFLTRSRPAWCVDCIDRMTFEAGAMPDEAFVSPKAWRLMTCTTCGTQAHYRFEYIVQTLDAVAPQVCRACSWAKWSDAWGAGEPLPAEAALRIELDLIGYDFVSAPFGYSRSSNPVVAHCRKCGRISAARMSDFTFRCECSRNQKSASSNRPRGARTDDNLLASSNSPMLEWWDHDRNDPATLATVTIQARRAVAWVCPEGHEFTASVIAMSRKLACPTCAEARRISVDARRSRLTHASIADVPELLAAWDDSAEPSMVPVTTINMVHLRCPEGHRVWSTPLTFLENGCPFCRAAVTIVGRSVALIDQAPEMASQWHPSRNGRLSVDSITVGSNRGCWWLCSDCGLEWNATPKERNRSGRMRCARCATILDSLGWQDPGLAAEWSPRNPLTVWQIRPTAALAFEPEWVCSVNADHVWTASTASRSAGSDCPDCRTAGKSRVELDHHAAIDAVIAGARSGALVTDTAFSTRRKWTIDVLADLDGRQIAIEYDGAYWHAPEAKQLVDQRKTLDLLAAGYLVVRLREHPLSPLPITNDAYREITVYSTAPRPAAVADEVLAWAVAVVANAETVSP